MAYNLILGDYKITNDPLNIMVSKRVYKDNKPTERFSTNSTAYYPNLKLALKSIKQDYENSGQSVVTDLQSFIQLETSFQDMFNQQLDAIEKAAKENGLNITEGK